MAATSQEYILERKTGENTSEEIQIPADSVVGLADVATSGSYNDLGNVPTNLVTTDTPQNITGEKKFFNNLIIGAKDDSTTGFRVVQGETAGGDDIFSVYMNGVNIDPDGLDDIPLKIQGKTGTSGQVLTSRGAGKTPIWSNISGGVQVITASTINIASLSNGIYLWQFTSGTSSYTLTGVGIITTPSTFTFVPESYSKLAILEVKSTTTYRDFTLSYDVPSPLTTGGKKTITYMPTVGKIVEYSNWAANADISSSGGGIAIIDNSVKAANLKVTILPDATTNGETNNVTVTVGGTSTTTIKTIAKSPENFPMSLVFEKTYGGGLLISETALDGAFDSFGNGSDSELYDDEINITIKYTTERSSVYTYFTLNGVTTTPITYS